MIIDAHLHAWMLASAEFPWHPLANVAPDYAWPIEASIQVLDKSNIDAGILIQPSMYSFDNRYVAGCGRRFPDRLRVMGLVDPRAGSMEEDLAALASAGFCGIRLAPMLRPDIDWYGTPASDRLWNKAADLDLVIGLLITQAQVPAVTPTIAAFENVRVVVDHLARPDLSDGRLSDDFLSLAKFKNVLVKVSALGFMSSEPYPHADALQWVRQVYDAFGPGRMMWGTDTPMSQEPDRVTTAMELISLALPETPAHEVEMIMGDTAAGLFGLRE